MGCKEKLQDYLRGRQVSFQVQQHQLAYTAQETAASEHIPGKLFAKPVIVFADDRLVMLVLPALHQVDFTRAAQATGAQKVRLAHEDDFATVFPDCEVGAMPPFGNLYGLPVYVDKALTEDETIVFPAGTHTETISMKYADYERAVQPVVAEFRHPARV